MKRFVTSILLLSVILATVFSMGGCFPFNFGRQEDSDSSSSENGGGNTESENKNGDEDLEGYIALTEGGKPLYVLAYQSQGLTEGLAGAAVAGDYAKVANNFAAELEALADNVDFTVVSDRNLSAETEKIIAIGKIAGVNDTAYEGLKYQDYKLSLKDGNIGIAAYNNGTLTSAVNDVKKELKTVGGDIYVKESVFSKGYSYRYKISEITVGDRDIAEYTIYCGNAEISAARLLRGRICDLSGVILPISMESKNGPAIEITKLESVKGYSMETVEGDTLIYYSSDMDWDLLWQYITAELNKVEYAGTLDLATLKSAKDSSEGRKIMSFNVLNVWNKNGTPGKRDDTTAALFLNYMPDFVGLQEFDVPYRNAENGLISMISEYYAEVEIEGVDKNYIWNPIFYLKDKYTVVESGFVYFPDSSSSSYESEYYADSVGNMSRFRSFVWAVLRDAQGREYLVGNLHFSPGNLTDIGVAHTEESQLVINAVNDVLSRHGDCVTLITGDYNSRRNSAGGIGKMMSAGFADTYDMAESRTDLSTTHETGAEPTVGYLSGAIDHVLTRGELDVEAYIILKDSEVLGISDHCPTVVQFTVY